MSGDVDDQTLVERMAAGDRDALGELYDRYASVLMALGVRRLHDRQEVEDVLHDVFMEAWAKGHTYDPERGSVRTWLCLLMRSRTIDASRKVRRTRTDSLEASTLQEDDLLADDDPSTRPDEAKLRHSLTSLPDRLQKVLVLFYFTGLTCREAAERIDIPIGTVKSRLRAARKALRHSLLGDQGGER